MFKKSIIQKILGTVLALFLSFGSVSVSWASAYWRGGGDMTAAGAKAAKEAAAAAVALAAAAVAKCKVDVSTAKAALEAAKKAAFGIPAAAAAVAKAAAALAAAEAALASATAAAAKLGVGAAVVGAGILVGQSIDYFIDWCWDPICDLTAVNHGDGPIYNGLATVQEVNQIIPQMLSIVSAQHLGISDLDPAGLQFLQHEVRMGLVVLQGAAAFTAGRHDEVDRALKDLQQELNTFPDTIKNFVEVYQDVTFRSPAPQLASAFNDFSAAIDEARQVLLNERSNPGADIAKIDEALKELASALGHFQQAKDDASNLKDLPLFGPGGAFPNLTLDGFKQFISDCATKGKDCLPPEEIALAKMLVEVAGVHSPSTPDGDFGDKIAEWDAFFHDNTEDYPLFEDPSGLSPLEVLLNSATAKSKNGSWLGIDLNESPLMDWLKEIFKKLGLPEPAPLPLPNDEDGMPPKPEPLHQEEVGFQNLGTGGCSLTTIQQISANSTVQAFGAVLFGMFSLIVGYRIRARKRLA